MITLDRWYDENGVFHYLRYYPEHAIGGKHFRKMPVKNTRCYRGGNGYFRYPKTFQELREIDSFYHDEELRLLKVKHRKRRNYIPTAWDDLWRRDNKNWKKQRRTQWKPK